MNSTTHNWNTIHVCDNVCFLKGGLHASCKNVAFEGGQLATMFVSQVSYMHLRKNVFLGRSPIYSKVSLQRWAICIFGNNVHFQRWSICVLITTMFFQEVNLSSKGNFQYKSYNKKGSAYVIPYVNPSIQHPWGAPQHVQYTSSCKL